jgi:hypothetical protein
MRILSGLSLLAVSTALSGCVSTTLDNLSNGCTTATLNVSCTANTGTNANSNNNTGGTTGGTGVVNTNSGNTSTLAATAKTDTTLAMESNRAVSNQTTQAVSILSSKPLLSNDPLTSTASTMSININTNTANNTNWPLMKTMDYYVPGGTTSAVSTNYAEYHSLTDSYDEELQVWSWGDSYTTQYRDVTNSGTAPLHQAWSFGGNYTPKATMDALKTANATANYTGTWTSTAQTSNFVDSSDPAQTVSHNNNWRVVGTSALQANFGTGAFNGQLHSTSWEGKDKDGFWTIVLPGSGTLNELPVAMRADVLLKGVITSDAVKGNKILGNANVDPAKGWLTTNGTNPMYGGFFSPTGAAVGAAPTEVAGVFAVRTAVPDPYGGNKGINGDTRGFLSMSGMFHGQ